MALFNKTVLDQQDDGKKEIPITDNAGNIIGYTTLEEQGYTSSGSKSISTGVTPFPVYREIKKPKFDTYELLKDEFKVKEGNYSFDDPKQKAEDLKIFKDRMKRRVYLEHKNKYGLYMTEQEQKDYNNMSPTYNDTDDFSDENKNLKNQIDNLEREVQRLNKKK